MPEDERLGNSRLLCNRFGRGSLKPLLRKQSGRDLENLLATIGRSEAGLGGCHDDGCQDK
jgi:hypothetical protein